MYSELSNLIRTLRQTLMLMGNFNEIISIEDIRGLNRVIEFMKQFPDFLIVSGLIDERLGNTKYT